MSEFRTGSFSEASAKRGAAYLDKKIPELDSLEDTGVTKVTALIDMGFAGNPKENSENTKATNQIPKPDECPCFRVYDQFMAYENKKLPPGVWYFELNQDNEIIKTRVCSPLYIDAVTFDQQGNNFGRLLRFKTTRGIWRKWSLPMEMLKGSGDEMRGELLSMGVEIQPGSKARNLLSMYLQSNPPSKQIQCVLQVGWCGDSFVLPDKVYGKNADTIIFQSGERNQDEYTTAGTLEGWRKNIAAYAVGNPILILALSSAFAGALIKRCHADGGGIHFVGESSTGKTTAGKVASSVWGGDHYRRSWRTTANGLEGVAMLVNDGLLVLDEINECDPREVGTIVYSLGNGIGKQRANRSGNARGVNCWKCFVLSNGEKSIPTVMSEGGTRYNAGQAVRMLDIPVERQYGIYDNLHHFKAGHEMADWLVKEVLVNYGVAGRYFLEKLAHDKQDFSAKLHRIKELPLFQVDGAQGQHKRAAARFALIGLAGELATEYGVTGWPEGEAIKSAAEGFRIWCEARGKGNSEKNQVIQQLIDFIDRHADSRFSQINGADNALIRDRAGWWENDGTTRVYLFTSGGLHDALRGYDFKRSLDMLVSIGALPQPNDAKGKRSVQKKIGGKNTPVYKINPEKLSEAIHEP